MGEAVKSALDSIKMIDVRAILVKDRLDNHIKGPS
jgi:hypothetical protein